ncbi:MAG: hypothetical protein R3F54_30145 [Alphaproteobacteria bacterium]
MEELNQHFPADDFAEDWGITFGKSQSPDGNIPTASLFATMQEMVQQVTQSAKRVNYQLTRGERVAVLSLDHDRFDTYCRAGFFRDEFINVCSRDEIGMIQRYNKRAILSMPEYVAGLQFHTVFLLDVNAQLVTQLGGGPNGLQRFISASYLGASRAMCGLNLYADGSAGGFAEPIRAAIQSGVLRPLES